MADDAPTAYCPHCEDDTRVLPTVPWQADVCRTCGNPYPED